VGEEEKVSSSPTKEGTDKREVSGRGIQLDQTWEREEWYGGRGALTPKKGWEKTIS